MSSEPEHQREDESSESSERPSQHDEKHEDAGEPQQFEEESYLLAQSLQYNAPLPPPTWMEHYDRIAPGSGRQMIEDVHKQSEHRRGIERNESDAQITISKRGQWIGGGLVALVILGGFGLAWFEKSVPGGIALALVGLAALATVFVSSSLKGRRQGQDNEPQPPAQQ